MAEPISPLADAYRPGSHGNVARGVGVSIFETSPGSIIEVSAWRGGEHALVAAITEATGLALSAEPNSGAVSGQRSGFGVAPGRFLLVDQAEGLGQVLLSALPIDLGTVTDLSHGRTAIGIEGEKVEWVLAKFFALDFSTAAFPVESGRATVHHDVLAQIQRTGAKRFDLYVFRSFARSFWTALCHGAEEVGCEVR
ncbi:sarcosine oxidase subunit gamma family protein [Mesorhizobium sp. CAU 1741]|uniref:sarcosine oxidase subunit gamma family protein n=1 Tax=Mesorhizobium sp. CAU 1741 TaxID=3140366 RepID=UPI00325B146D